MSQNHKFIHSYFNVLDEETMQKKALPAINEGVISTISNTSRIYAANEVAEISKLLGKPLTDAKALGLIKNLLLDKVHSHMAKTMDLDELAENQPVMEPPTNPGNFIIYLSFTCISLKVLYDVGVQS